MGIRGVAASMVLALGLGGCATDPGYGLRYEDGSYYSMAGEGRGDYYVGRAYDNVRYIGDPYFDEFAWLHAGGPWVGGWYGSPFYSYGGYCSVRYRYCPPGGWADPFPRYDFRLYFGDPWYDGYRDDRYERWPRRPRHRDGQHQDGAPPPPGQRPPPRRENTRPARPLREPDDMRSEDRSDTPRGRRGGVIRREVSPPSPRR